MERKPLVIDIAALEAAFGNNSPEFRAYFDTHTGAVATLQGPALPGSEDFAFMLEKLPGCYFFIGNGDGDSAGACMVHNPGYNFNDDNIGVGSAMWVALAQRYLGV